MKSSSLKLLTISALSLLLTTTLSAEIVRTQTYKANVVEDATVVLNGDIADIVMMPSNSDEVSLEITYKFKTDSEEKANEIQEKIKITYEANESKVLFKQEYINKKKLFQGNCPDIQILAYIPNGPTVKASAVSGDIDCELVKNRLYLETVSGDVTLTDLLGDVDANTVSGDIKARSISGSFYSESVSGDIQTEQISKDATAESVSGDISLVTSKGNINLETVSGDIHLRMIEEPFAVNVESVSGDVDFECKKAMNFKINLESMSGEMDCQYPLSNMSKKDDHLIGTLGEGTVPIDIETVSGNIRIK
ncbi:MAG: DUF4097 family beta strand repeat protein [Opitutales bacterium]|nr:DUF4097 family beta strand repeat protein [Opitutales bacterium]